MSEDLRDLVLKIAQTSGAAVLDAEAGKITWEAAYNEIKQQIK